MHLAYPKQSGGRYEVTVPPDQDFRFWAFSSDLILEDSAGREMEGRGAHQTVRVAREEEERVLTLRVTGRRAKQPRVPVVRPPQRTPPPHTIPDSREPPPIPTRGLQ